jgi:RNA polymerase sigma-B factor
MSSSQTSGATHLDAKRPREGDLDPKRQRLITEHLGLARYLAHRFVTRGEPLEDLQQVASLALVSAARRFDPSLGHEFSSFAAQTIIGELKHHFRDRAWAVRAPRHVQELYLEVSALLGELAQRLGRTPTTRELAEACGHSERDVAAAIAAGRGYRTRSIDATGSLDALCDRWVDVDGGIEGIELRAELAAHLMRLPARDRAVLRLRFAEEMSQSEIAVELGISQMQVSRVLRRALDELREAFGNDA